MITKQLVSHSAENKAVLLHKIHKVKHYLMKNNSDDKTF